MKVAVLFLLLSLSSYSRGESYDSSSYNSSYNGSTYGGANNNSSYNSNYNSNYNSSYDSNYNSSYYSGPNSGSKISLGALSGACPFKGNNQNVQALLGATKSALSSLANSKECPQVRGTASQLENALNNSLLSALPSMNVGTVDCNNYEMVLRHEFDLAVSGNKNEYIKGALMNSSYATCMSAASFEECAAKTYTENLSFQAQRCSKEASVRGTNNQNQATREALNNVAHLTEDLIRSSSSCKDGDQIAKGVLQTAIGSMTAISSAAPGLGLAGIGITLGGKILSAITDRFFDEKSPRKMIAAIEEEEKAEDLNCLYFLLQKESLGCDGELLKEAGKSINPNCVGSSDKSSPLNRLQDNMRDILNKGPNSTQQSRQDAFYNFIRNLDEPIGSIDDDSRKVPFHQYLRSLSQQLGSTQDLESRKIASKLGNFLTSYDKMKSKLKAPGNKMQDVSADELELMKALDDLGADGFERGIEKYWAMKGKGDSLSKLRDHERVVSDINTGNKVSAALAMEINNAIGDANSQRKIDVAHSAFVNSFRKRNSDRLQKINSVWQKNRGLQDNDDAVKDMIPVVQMCTLNAGLSYFGESDFEVKSRNIISKQIPSEYKEACEQFKCKLPIFDPAKFADNQRPREYKKYQCAMYIRYQDIVSDLSKNMRQTGKPCP